jgi:hypothetical protein
MATLARHADTPPDLAVHLQRTPPIEVSGDQWGTPFSLSAFCIARVGVVVAGASASGTMRLVTCVQSRSEDSNWPASPKEAEQVTKSGGTSMKTTLAVPILVGVLLALLPSASARELILPAGTLLQCTLDEPNFSSATADVGDPVLCHPRAIQQFGQSVFPRGTYIVGHLESAKNPGHFFGKGNLKLVFDRIGLPATDLPLPGKVIAVRGYKVDREGKIVGHGHPTRDVVEWMLPPLWPWKLMMLPARGPRPALKGEVSVTMRLMDDVAVPQASAWRRFGSDDASLRGQGPAPQNSALPAAAAEPTLQLAVNHTSSQPQPEPQLSTASVTGNSAWRSFSPNAAVTPAPSLTLFALKGGSVYAVSNYQVESDILHYELPNGDVGSVRLATIDWDTTTQLNAERHVRVSLRRAPSSDLSMDNLTSEQ